MLNLTYFLYTSIKIFSKYLTRVVLVISFIALGLVVFPLVQNCPILYYFQVLYLHLVLFHLNRMQYYVRLKLPL